MTCSICYKELTAKEAATHMKTHTPADNRAALKAWSSIGEKWRDLIDKIKGKAN
jgi:hypothetical protein